MCRPLCNAPKVRRRARWRRQRRPSIVGVRLRGLWRRWYQAADVWHLNSAGGTSTAQGGDDRMRRRDLMIMLGGAALGCPSTAWAQRAPKGAHLGYLWIGAEGSEDADLLGALRQGLAELGYVEGRDFVI